MNEKLAGLLQQLRKFWGSLSNPKRFALIGGTLGVLALVLALSFVGSREHYSFLYTDLSAEDAAAISSKLKELKVPYRIEAGGSAIQIPEERVHEVRLELAGQGLPRGGGVGFELFDKSHLGATEFEQHIHLRRALEGELARTVGSIGDVQSAKVHLVLPERSVFTATKEHATASVMVRLRPGRSLAKGEVASIVHLVASAVPGLTEDRISVVSATGETLHRPRSSGPGGSGLDGEAEAERERAIAASLEEQAKAMLERVVGPGHVDVRVGVEVDPSAKERTEEHYEPSKTVLRSEQRTDEQSGSDEQAAIGPPGASSNDPNAAPAIAEPATGTGTARHSLTRNWEVDRVTEKTSLPAGRVSRLSVAVLVDGIYKANGDAKEFVARDRAELDRLSELVKNAVGYNAARGDQIQVDCAQFAAPETPDAGATEETASKTQKYLPWAVGGAAGLLLLALLVLLARRRSKATLDAEAAAASADTALPVPAETPPMTPAQLLEAARDTRELTRQTALEIAARDPATAAIILRDWLNTPSVGATAQS